MEPYIIKPHNDEQFIRQVEKEFSRIYPFLRIELENVGKEKRADGEFEGTLDDFFRTKAKRLLKEEIALNDNMTISELQIALQSIFLSPVTIFRKNALSWLEITRARYWTLKQQNESGMICLLTEKD